MKAYLNRILMIVVGVLGLPMVNDSLATNPQPNCESLGAAVGVAFDCSLGGPPTEVIIIKPGTPKGNPIFCTCNTTLVSCNANITGQGGCLTGGGLDQVWSDGVFANDGTTFCRTIGGERKCWKRSP